MDIFQNFHPVIATWFKNSYEKPSPPQTIGWPAISADKNVLILAPTGSGKTLAAFLWSINVLFKRSLTEDHEQFTRNISGVHTLYISPLKALNNDIERNLNQPLTGITHLAREKGIHVPHIRVLVRTGDTSQSVRNVIVKNPPHILITTPESLYLLLTSTRGRLIFSNLKYVIIDEIHALCAVKRGVHLNLSLERLTTITRQAPVRIGLSATQRPLNRIARFLGGWQFDPGNMKYKERPVEILDCGSKKELDLKVICPVPRFNDMGEASVWPAVLALLYELITTHRTTLIFANMRAQTERLARKLNDLHHVRTGNEDATLILPHHGSMSREKRFDVEERLKRGEIPAVIATASLELGIDIGSIDLVVQLEAPKTIANGIQRIGRSGHLVSLKSKGRVIPLYPADLDDAAATVKGMLEGEIEETVIPENCLDVLAQQIVAEVAMQKWPAEKLYQIYTQSYCYHNLPRQVFDQVLEMLTGRYADTRLPALQPVISWDRINDSLVARRSARLQAVMNGGTIPDRGYYSVVLADEHTRLGEMEEEFVFESRIGDIFYLGNNEWRIDDIRQDRIIVSANQSVQPREPFWKGEIPYRDYQTSLKIGRFRTWLLENIDRSDVNEILMSDYALDLESAENLVIYWKHQQQLTGKIPTHRLIVAEWFYDSANEINFILHAPFGGRVLGLWAMAMAAHLESEFGTQTQYTNNDDALLIRIRETVGEPPIGDLLKLPVDKVESLIHEKISSAPVFSVIFRHNAGRALLLTRSRPGQRIPLWVQRLRSADLLQAVRHYPDFPVLLETYRSCLQDVFDLNSLRTVLTDLQTGKIGAHIIKTPSPSPMASGLLFNFVTNQMYEQDRSREPARVAAVSSDLLAQIMDRKTIPAIITRGLIQKNMQKWQYLSPLYRPRDGEELFNMIEDLGPISRGQILDRVGSAMKSALEKLIAAGRVIEIPQGWVTDSRIHLYREPLDKNKYLKRLQYYLENRGPEKISEIIEATQIKMPEIMNLLQHLVAERRIIHGLLVEGSDDEYYCDRENFALLYRSAVAFRRQKTTAVTQQDYLKFLLSWHRAENIQDILQKYRDFRLPFLHFEREILTTRLAKKGLNDYSRILSDLRQLISEGKVVYFFDPDTVSGEQYIKFINRGEGWFSNYQGFTINNERLSAVLNFLKENGASFLDDLEEGLQQPRNSLVRDLKDLTRAGMISCENYDTLLLFGKSDTSLKIRAGARQRASESVRMGTGRWFRMDTFGILGRRSTRSDAAAWQARLLLYRYGILVKELYRFEHGMLPWYEIFQALKILEWQGEIRRGYFIKGLSGVQFALPEAVAMLENHGIHRAEIPSHQLINVLDPALPFGGSLPWPVEFPQKILRLPGNHLGFVYGKPAVYCERYFSRWFTTDDLEEEDLAELIMLTRNWLMLPEPYRPKKKIRVEMVNGIAAADSHSAGRFMQAGFEKDGTNLVLWPSAL